MFSCTGQRRKVTPRLVTNRPFLYHVANRQWNCFHGSKGYQESSQYLGDRGRRIIEKPGLYSELQTRQKQKYCSRNKETKIKLKTRHRGVGFCFSFLLGIYVCKQNQEWEFRNCRTAGSGHTKAARLLKLLKITECLPLCGLLQQAEAVQWLPFLFELHLDKELRSAALPWQQPR